MSLDQVNRFLDQLGWKHDPVSTDIIRTYYSGQFGSVVVMLHLADRKLVLAIDPVLTQPSDGWGPSVERLVGVLAREAQLIQVGLDRSKDVFVRVEIPRDEVGFEEFVYVLLNLCQVSDQLLVPVLQAQAYDSYVAPTASLTPA